MGKDEPVEGASVVVQQMRVLIVVQNLPVPMDRRVWLECQSLRDAGYQVSVICPKAPRDPGYEFLDGIHVYKYRPGPATTGLLSYIFEFVYCWLRTALLSGRVRRRQGFDVIQACNPPDTYWLLGWLWRPFGVKFVYDQHDLNPELFRSRFGEPTTRRARWQLAVLEWLERMTYLTSCHVIATNESYRQIAIGRGGRKPEQVTVVRSGPNTSAMRPVQPRPELRAGADHLLAYVGIMGPQDNVDILIRVMDELVNKRGRPNLHLALLGFGDCLESLQQLTADLGLQGNVTFTGRADQRMIAEYLSSADLGLSPDLKTALNDVSTHNKVMEYMAYALPSVSFNLVENEVSALDSAVYVPSGDISGFADAICDLLDDPARRLQMARLARQRCSAELDWQAQAVSYVEVYDQVFDIVRSDDESPESGVAAAGEVERRRGLSDLPVIAGREAVDLRNPADFDDYILSRGGCPGRLTSLASGILPTM